MALPLIPIIVAALTATAVGTALWYTSLTSEEQEEANEKAERRCKLIFNKALKEANPWEIARVYKEIKNEW